MRYEEFTIEGRNAVLEAFRSGKTIDKLFVLDGCHDGPVNTITREARKGDTIINYVSKERLDSMSKTGKHQGVIAYAAAYEYAEVSDILDAAKEKGEPPFIFILDNIEDPHNLGSIIRVAECAGIDGIIIGKHRAASVTDTVMRISEGGANHVAITKVTNINSAIEKLKENNIWVYGLELGGSDIYKTNLKGRLAIVIGGEDTGINRLTKEKCDGVMSIKMHGKINSLNASVACGVAVFEALRQRQN